MDLERCPHDGARLTKLKARPDELLGRVFDNRYEIRTALGGGGMGTVYRGWQLSVDREVAIKVIHAKLGGDRTVVKRFLREARLSSRLSQPNIVNVYDFGQGDDGILYIVMELIRGRTLAKELDAQRPLAQKRITTIALQLCDALEAAHGQGIIHRDLKPGNIMILDEPPGRDLLKVLDFGLSKSLASDTTSLVTQSSALLGTPLYMSPEQIEGKPSDQRGDLYSVGCMLYQMATGRPPFVGPTVNGVLAAHISDPMPPLPGSVPAPLAELIAQLMQKVPDRRPPSAAIVRDAIQRIAEGGNAELSDTTPDIREIRDARDARDASDASIQRRRTGPVALAVTMAAPAAPAPRRGSRWQWLAGGFSLATVAVIAMIALGQGSKDAAAPPSDKRADRLAGAPPPADAMPLAAVPVADASAPRSVDAAAPADAAHRAPAVPIVVRHHPVDAGAPDAAAPRSIDAGAPDLNFAPRPK
jgi:serine/threonine-protein kinase